MKILIFFSRIALICNICFIIAEIMRYSHELQLNPFYSTIVILGYVSIILNVLLGLAFVMMFVKKRFRPHSTRGGYTGMFADISIDPATLANSIPRWLLIINFLFLIAQIFIFLS